MWHESGLQYLIHRDMDLSAKCKDLQNRLRCMDLKRKWRKGYGQVCETATSRMIVTFLNAAIKDKIIEQAWSQRQVFFQDKRIFFNQDYTPNVEKS